MMMLMGPVCLLSQGRFEEPIPFLSAPGTFTFTWLTMSNWNCCALFCEVLSVSDNEDDIESCSTSSDEDDDDEIVLSSSNSDTEAVDRKNSGVPVKTEVLTLSPQTTADDADKVAVTDAVDVTGIDRVADISIEDSDDDDDEDDIDKSSDSGNYRQPICGSF